MSEAVSVPIYVPGRKVVCTTDDIALEFHSRGWFSPEPDRIWIDGVEGELKFMVRRPATSYTFAAEISPFASPPPQSLELFFNYHRVEYFEIAKRGEISVELPAEVFTLRTCIVRLHCRNAISGTSVGIEDPRRLGIALHSWVLT